MSPRAYTNVAPNGESKMKLWVVYYAGEFVGYVNERTESLARCAAFSYHQPRDTNGDGLWDSDELSVYERELAKGIATPLAVATFQMPKCLEFPKKIGGSRGAVEALIQVRL